MHSTDFRQTVTPGPLPPCPLAEARLLERPTSTHHLAMSGDATGGRLS